MDQLTILTEADKSSVAYGVCVGGSALVGMAVGRFGGLPGLLAGGAVGLRIGLAACRHLREPIKQKLFSPLSRLSDDELENALRAIRLESPVTSKRQALGILALLRADASANPGRYRSV